MESIEKLRKYADGFVTVQTHDDLMGIIDEIEAEIAERYMELPTDADGMPIKVGDECWDKDTAERFKVASIEWNGVCWSAWSVPDTRHIANKVLHHKPRTLEDVLQKMMFEWVEAFNADHAVDFKPKMLKYADEIRELLGVDE